MKKLAKRYFQWLFQPNVVTYQSEKSIDQLIFEGKSNAFWTLIINTCGTLSVIFLPIILLAYEIKHPVITILSVILLLTAFIAFGIGMIAMAYQPFWQHKNQLILSKNGVFTKNSVGFPRKTSAKRIKKFQLRFQIINPQTLHMQFWLNGKKRYFINTYVHHLPTNEAQIFDFFRPCMLQWGFTNYDIHPTKDTSIGIFEFLKVGKNALDNNTNFDQLKQQAQETNLQLNKELEIFAKFALKQIETKENVKELLITRRPGFKRRNWIFFLSSFLGGIGFMALLIFGASDVKSDNQIGLYVFTGCIAFLWIIFSWVSLDNIFSDFLIRVNKSQLYFQKRKNKGITFEVNNIQRLVIRGKVQSGRTTHLFGDIFLELNKKILFGKKEIQELKLLMVDSGRPEKIDTQLVRDAVYERSMRIAQIIGHTLDVEVIWEGFER